MYPNTVMAMGRVLGVTVGVAVVAALAVPTDAAESDDAYDVAVAIARDGPRPAASRAERRAHIRLREAFKSAGLTVELPRFRVPGKGRSRNVIGVYDSPRECLRIVMAHTDSTPWGPGANDNASGVGVLAALAPRLAKLKPGCDVWLVATGAEERVYTGSPDHLGALALARLVKRRGLHRHLRYALSLDEVGRDRPFWLRSPVRRPRRGVEGQFAVRWVRDDSTGNSDHREFELMGMRGAKLGVGAGGEPCRHTACDRVSRLRRSSLEAARKLVERALRER
jgi:aminopeptidase YwaD